MNTQQQLNYQRIAEAIEYLRENFRSQPSLDQVAAKVHLSPFHFQRLFTDWAGVSPKKFLQFLSVEYAKEVLQDPATTLLTAADETGLSGSGRLHDLFIKLEGMTPGEYKNGGESLTIHYSYAQSPFGDILVASTAKGICYLAFADDSEAALADLKSRFPRAQYLQKLDLVQQNALFVFRNDWTRLPQIKLHLKATDFQLKVWSALLQIPSGKLSSYGQIAGALHQPGAARAVGTAISNNPIAYLIPCHRVIQSAGLTGGYRWGPTRKTAIIGWEAARVQMAG